MEAAGWTTIIGAITIGLLQLLSLWLNYLREQRRLDREAMTDKKIHEVSEQVVAAAENIQKVEVATNSMKDQLVEATRAAAELVGQKQGRAEQKAEQKADAADKKAK